MDFSIFSNFGNKSEASLDISGTLWISLLASIFSLSVLLISSSESRFSLTRSSSLISISGRTSSSSIDGSISGVSNKSNRMIESSAMSLVSSSKIISLSLF